VIYETIELSEEGTPRRLGFSFIFKFYFKSVIGTTNGAGITVCHIRKNGIVPLPHTT
jgi:hypothetical protein